MGRQGQAAPLAAAFQRVSRMAVNEALSVLFPPFCPLFCPGRSCSAQWLDCRRDCFRAPGGGVCFSDAGDGKEENPERAWGFLNDLLIDVRQSN